MNNIRETKYLNVLKRLFCLIVALILMTTMLPTSVFAASKEIVMVTNSGLSVEGYPNSALPIGGGYELHIVQEGSAFVMELSGPNYNTRQIYTGLTDSRSYVTWNGITITRNSAYESWQTSQSCVFNVVDDDSSTTVSSNNITMKNISRTRIRENNDFTVTFQIIDYNMDASGVDEGVVPYLTGYNSSGSFILRNDTIEFERITHESGKYAFKVTLPLRYTGKGNLVSFTLAYKNSQGTLRTLDCTTTIPRTEETVDDDDDDDDDDKAIDTLIPYIIVDSYSYGGNSVTAGEEFTLTLHLRNTSTTHSLENVVMNVSPMGVFSMTSSSNTFFINRLQAGGVLEHAVTLKAGLTKVTDDDDANSIDIKFTYQYSGKDSKTLEPGNSSESITLPVDFPDRFELGIPEHDDMAFAGEEFYISVPMVNKGRSSVYNLTAFVRGDMRNPGQSQYVGNLAAGTESSADFSVIFDQPGDYSGEIVVTYEDANMNPKEVVAVFNISVEDMWGGGIDPSFPGMEPEEPVEPAVTEPQHDPVKPVKVVVGLVVCVMSAYVTIQKAKAKRSIFLDEDI